MRKKKPRNKIEEPFLYTLTNGLGQRSYFRTLLSRMKDNKISEFLAKGQTLCSEDISSCSPIYSSKFAFTQSCFIYPFVQNRFFPALFYKATPGPWGGQGGERGPCNQGAPGRSPTLSHLCWGLGVGGSGGESPDRANAPPEPWGAQGRGWGALAPWSGIKSCCLQLPTSVPVLQRLLPRTNNK